MGRLPLFAEMYSGNFLIFSSRIVLYRRAALRGLGVAQCAYLSGEARPSRRLLARKINASPISWCAQPLRE